MSEGDYENVFDRYLNDQEFRIKTTLGGGLAIFTGASLASTGVIGVETNDFSYLLENIGLDNYESILENDLHEY